MNSLHELWRNRAACRQKQRIYYSVNGKLVQQAIATCHSVCDVRRQCLAYALLYIDDDLVWGGLSSDERKHVMQIGKITPDFFSMQEHILNDYAESLIAPPKRKWTFEESIKTAFANLKLAI